jgi:hypothetical protein
MTEQPRALADLTIDGRPVLLQDVAARLPTCLLCGGEPVMVGCFVPHPSRVQAVLDVTEPLIGPVRPGKARAAFYALCLACAMEPTTAAAVEARLLGEAGP